MKRIGLFLILSVALLAQTKPNLVDTKPPAVPSPTTTYALTLPGFQLLAIDVALIDKATTPPTLRVPPGQGTGQLWDDTVLFSGSQSFPTLSAPLGRVYVFKNGILMTINADYTQVTNSGLITVTFLPVQPIGTGDRVTLLYMK